MQSALNEDRTRRELIDNQPSPPDGLKGMNRLETGGFSSSLTPTASCPQPFAGCHAARLSGSMRVLPRGIWLNFPNTLLECGALNMQWESSSSECQFKVD
jgi:hypothetical protein